MRFILNFFFFGILFYLIYLFFPDMFNTLVAWANHVYLFLKDIVLQISAKIHSMRGPGNHPSPQPALIFPLMAILLKEKYFE